MKSIRRYLIALTLLLLCVSLLSVNAFAAREIASGTCGDNATWSLDSKGNLTISGNGPLDEADEKPWIIYLTQIKNVTISEGITTIGSNAFSYCNKLKSISLPSTLTEIGWGAFSDTALTEVTIPAGVCSIDFGAFQDCEKLTDIQVAGENQYYVSIDGVVFSKDMTTLLAYPAGRSGGYTIPEGVTTIETRAFTNCDNLTKIRFPSTLQTIGVVAFASCDALESLELPDGLRDIACAAFYGCSDLTAVTIPGSVQRIGAEAFSCCESLRKLTLCEGVSVIEEEAFDLCTDLKTVILPNSLTRIDASAFSYVRKREVFYSGSSCDWENINFGGGNYSITQADVQFFSPIDTSVPNITGMKSTASGIRITWSGVKGARQYRVFLKTAKGWKTLTTTTGTSYLYTGATSGQTCVFTIRCVNAAGTAYTSDYHRTGWKHTFTTQPTIAKMENTADGIVLRWKAVPGAERYRVFVKTDTGWKTIGITDKNYMTYKAVESGKTYTFTVRCTTVKRSYYTSSYNATGWKQTYVAQPGISKLENVDEGIKISWRPVAGAIRYRVFVMTDRGWQQVATTAGTSLIWRKAQKGQEYTFTIRCVNLQNNAFTSSYNPDGWKIRRM